MRNNRKYNLLVIEEEDDKRGAMLKAFGKNLKKLRKAKGLTQQQLGDLANINYKFYGDVERGLKNPSSVVIYKLANALGVSVSEILKVEECQSTEVDMLKEVEKLFEGKEEKNKQKAIRILEVFFE